MAIPTLRSPTVPSGGLVPEKHTSKGEGISPALEWRRIPNGHLYMTTIVRSWSLSGVDECVHLLVYDAFEFLGGLAENIAANGSWTLGYNSTGAVGYLPFGRKEPRRAQFEVFASKTSTGLDGPTSWEEIERHLKKQEAVGPFGFEAFDAALPELMAGR